MIEARNTAVPEQLPEEKQGGIDVAIMTVARQRVYIHRLLSQLKNDLTVRLIVGSPNCDYLQPYVAAPNLQILPPAQEEWTIFKECVIHHRASWNYWRSLTLGPSSSTSKGLLVFEDDVILSTGWENRLHATVSEIESIFSSQFVLALYTTANFGLPIYTRFYVNYPSRQFFGTQAMYFPNAVRKSFAEYLYSTNVTSYHVPYDVALKRYLKTNKTLLFATVPCLAQHIGVISTGLGQFHSTKAYHSEVRNS